MFTRRPSLQVLTLRRPPRRGHVWQPVTGKVDRTDASWTAAGCREVAEETGITDPLRVYDTGIDFRFEKKGGTFLERLIAFETDGPRPVVLSHEHVDYAWLAWPDAVARMERDIHAEGIRHVIAAVSSESP